jgi:iron(III) transport system ATP-binding protein
VELRDETRAVLKRHGTSAIFVTHDTGDALAIADRIVILKHGHIQQTGPPEEIYGSPVNAYVASFFGACNFIPPGHLPGNHHHIGPDEADGIWVRPERLSLGDGGQGGLKGVVRSVSFRGTYSEVVLECHCEVRGPFKVTVHYAGPPVQEGEARTIVSR